ncbi:hypothetical protein EDC01DRAFT_637059 [Geopyxis carbonaria]|nr:hypothetical protein EDC01DRAFT_637059 [Geopyxis carbonaria]
MAQAKTPSLPTQAPAATFRTHRFVARPKTDAKSNTGPQPTKHIPSRSPYLPHHGHLSHPSPKAKPVLLQKLLPATFHAHPPNHPYIIHQPSNPISSYNPLNYKTTRDPSPNEYPLRHRTNIRFVNERISASSQTDSIAQLLLAPLRTKHLLPFYALISYPLPHPPAFSTVCSATPLLRHYSNNKLLHLSRSDSPTTSNNTTIGLKHREPRNTLPALFQQCNPAIIEPIDEQETASWTTPTQTNGQPPIEPRSFRAPPP